MNEPEAKKILGQHWLHDETVLDAMCDAADVSKGDNVLEVGPGTGTLTKKLLDRGAKVIALEFDTELMASLLEKFAAQVDTQQVQIEPGDIRTYDLTTLPSGYKVVANIPYYLTAYLLRLLTETTNMPESVALLVQKEVAERVAARPGDMSFIAVVAQLYYEVDRGMLAPAELFTPPPKVDSQILIMKKRKTPLFEVNEKVLFQIVKAGFSNRRKTLLNSLSAGLRLGKDETTGILQAAAINPQARAQELSLDQWHKIYLQYLTH